MQPHLLCGKMKTSKKDTYLFACNAYAWSACNAHFSWGFGVAYACDAILKTMQTPLKLQVSVTPDTSIL